jgi:hypothetical protein
MLSDLMPSHVHHTLRANLSINMNMINLQSETVKKWLLVHGTSYYTCHHLIPLFLLFPDPNNDTDFLSTIQTLLKAPRIE